MGQRWMETALIHLGYRRLYFLQRYVHDPALLRVGTTQVTNGSDRELIDGAVIAIPRSMMSNSRKSLPLLLANDFGGFGTQRLTYFLWKEPGIENDC